MVTSEQILRCPMNKKDNGAEAERVGDYFTALLYNLWSDGEAFSGKRPFGNSSWEWDVYKALAKAGLVTGMVISTYKDCECGDNYDPENPCACKAYVYEEIDEFPYEEEKKAERLVMKAIMDMDKVTWND